jgi:hypothetical protein
VLPVPSQGLPRASSPARQLFLPPRYQLQAAAVELISACRWVTRVILRSRSLIISALPDVVGRVPWLMPAHLIPGCPWFAKHDQKIFVPGGELFFSKRSGSRTAAGLQSL